MTKKELMQKTEPAEEGSSGDTAYQRYNHRYGLSDNR
jgi:hypothetical protein